MNLSRRVFLSSLAAGATTAWYPAFAQTAEPLLIGVPLPLTGVTAVGGQVLLAGLKYAADEINAKGGVLARPIKLVVEDTKGEPNTAATVAAKLATVDKVYAFVGGFGSTADFAMLTGLRRYKPLFIHISSSSVKLEESFGKEDWYYHVFIWDYHRQRAAAAFLASLRPSVVDVLDGALGDRRPRRPGVRVERVERLPVGRVDELPADVVLEPFEPFRCGHAFTPAY